MASPTVSPPEKISPTRASASRSEAMAASVPVVAMASGAIPETVGSAGLLLESSSPAVFAEALDAVLGTPLGASLAVAGRARAHELSLEAATLRLEAFLDDRI